MAWRFRFESASLRGLLHPYIQNPQASPCLSVLTVTLADALPRVLYGLLAERRPIKCHWYI